MKIISTINKMRSFINEKESIGFVPTMGNLHRGHLSLVEESNRNNRHTVVSIFINPTQFGPGEDYDKYPRTFDEDIKKLETLKVDAVFFPEKKTMYRNQKVYVSEEAGLSGKLCGKYRPGHFKGVLTVVLKFFNIIRPDRAYFGRKDFQQFVLIKKMADDLNLDIEIVPCRIIRDSDGLALSSRNSYLSKEERENALCIHKCLIEAKNIFNNNELSSKNIIKRAGSILKPLKIQYIELIDPETLENVEKVDSKTVMAIAAFAGNTRLIDNTVLGEDFL
jgi:pantoate--beta-alanine ligase